MAQLMLTMGCSTQTHCVMFHNGGCLISSDHFTLPTPAVQWRVLLQLCLDHIVSCLFDNGIIGV